MQKPALLLTAWIRFLIVWANYMATFTPIWFILIRRVLFLVCFLTLLTVATSYIDEVYGFFSLSNQGFVCQEPGAYLRGSQDPAKTLFKVDVFNQSVVLRYETYQKLSFHLVVFKISMHGTKIVNQINMGGNVFLDSLKWRELNSSNLYI